MELVVKLCILLKIPNGSISIICKQYRDKYWFILFKDTATVVFVGIKAKKMNSKSLKKSI